eukprot:TRINITY_DN175_c0_g2_i1.p1 TRINITY_DN175_c0_g2~~TRINITY_DN175_c0_g2_i1.p1  ORF type:complete len:1231 (-),score=305.57 TRINITY_DN175_c0_g2_i1:245-3937(-)
MADISPEIEVEDLGQPQEAPEGVVVDQKDEVEEEEEEEEPKKEEEKAKLRFVLQLFKYANWLDVLLLLAGAIAALGQGITIPLSAYFLGDMVDAFYPIFPANISPNSSEFKANIKMGVHMGKIMEKVRIMFYLAIASFIGALLYVICFRLSAIRQSIRMRNRYFKSVLSQEISWSDARKAGELTERVNDILKIEEAMGDKFGAGLSALCTFVAGWAIGFTQGWKLSLVVVAATPSIFISVFVATFAIKVFTGKSQEALTHAGGVAEEVISCVRTVTSFMLQNVETQRYDKMLASSENSNRYKAISLGIGIGCLLGFNMAIDGLGFWYGCKIMRDGDMTAGEVTTTFFSIMLGTLAIGTLQPTLQAIAEGHGVAGPLFKIIDRKSQINRFSGAGSKPEIRGNVEFKNVEFSYPTRKKIKVLRGLNLSINESETVALVGTSGCGKSTTVSLLERLYTPNSGTVTVDGTSVSDFNLQYLRDNIGMVGQEPVLFAMTIRDNIALGLSAKVESVDFSLIEQAAKEANAHNFIIKLPQQYETLVGERGVQLSGGQKQRIAIARALIRNPRILLLDEATSALDTESERVVQEALDRASKGRTTIIIAHRLSTVRNAKIFVLDKGLVVESGRHDDLMAAGGVYSTLVHAQQVSLGEGEKSEVAEEVETANPHRHHHHRGRGHRHEDSQLLQVGFLTGVGEFPIAVESSTPAVDAVEETPIEKEQSAEAAPKEKKYHISTPRMLYRLAGFMKPYSLSLLGALISAMIDGAAFPVAGFLSAEALNTLASFDGTNNNETRKDTLKWAMCFVGVGVAVFVCHIFEFALIFRSYEGLVRLVRRHVFRAILRQDVGWFDLTENNVGTLTTRLAHDPEDLQGAAGVKITFTAQAFTGYIVGIAIGLAYCWQLGLLLMAIMPIFSAASFLKQKFEMDSATIISKAYEASATVACEAIEGVRTVVMLGREEKFLERHQKALVPPLRAGSITSLKIGVCNSISLTTPLIIMAIGFWYGCKLFQKDKTDFLGLMVTPTVMLFGEKVFSMTLAFAPSFGKAKVAMKNLFKILDRNPPIDSLHEGKLPEIDKINTISFRNINFAYPSRPNVQVLNDFSLDILGNKTYALVGESGCGKSTIMGLLQRFYSPLAGTVQVNGQDITELDLTWLRSQIGIVSQEPVLFGTTIKENIARGLCNEDVPTEDIIAAAKLANAHNFISALPLGYGASNLVGGLTRKLNQIRRLVSEGCR